MAPKNEVDIEEIRQLASWLAASGMRSIEIGRPGTTVRLKIDDRCYFDRESDRERDEDAPSFSSSVAGFTPEPDVRERQARQERLAHTTHVTAKTAGVFLASHPVRSTPLVAPSARVAQGEVIALLQVGHLYLPVVAPLAGRVMQRIAVPGATVGYGTPLFEISPEARRSAIYDTERAEGE